MVKSNSTNLESIYTQANCLVRIANDKREASGLDSVEIDFLKPIGYMLRYTQLKTLQEILFAYDSLINFFNQIDSQDKVLEIMPYTKRAKLLLNSQQLPNSTADSFNTFTILRGMLTAVELMLQGKVERDLGTFTNTSPNIGAASADTNPYARLLGIIGHFYERIMYRLYPDLGEVMEGHENEKDNFLHIIGEIVKLLIVSEQTIPGTEELIRVFRSPLSQEKEGGMDWVESHRVEDFQADYNTLLGIGTES